MKSLTTAVVIPKQSLLAKSVFYLTFFGSILSALLAWWGYHKYQQYKQVKLFSAPLAPDLISILKKNVPIYSFLPESLANQLHGLINIFLDDKKFIDRGVAITDEVRITVAGNACLLLLNNKIKNFPGFKSILIYPQAYIAHQTQEKDGVHSHEISKRAGESWVRGPIVLSWQDVMRGSLNPHDGHNVVIHEFAHKLDELSGHMNGAPALHEDTHYEEWSQVLSNEYISLQERAKRGKNKVMDDYGTVSPAEFFAVATETFFEKPKQMQKRIPDLYQQLSNYFRLDPASWH